MKQSTFAVIILLLIELLRAYPHISADIRRGPNHNPIPREARVYLAHMHSEREGGTTA